MGDFNAKIGSDNQGYENVMGVHGLGVMNDNGERFVNACAINNIVIGEACSHTKEYIRRHGYLLTKSLKIR